MTRNILNYNGICIGTLSLPDETTEDQWTDVLAIYAAPPPMPTLQQIVEAKLEAAIAFGTKMVTDAATQNVIDGVTAAGKYKDVSDFLQNLGRYLREGSLLAAIDEITLLTETDIPETVQPFVTAEKLIAAQGRIQSFLGIAPSEDE